MALLRVLTDASVAVAAPLFLGATVVVVVAGPRLTATANTLASRSRFGSTLVGSVLLGASTSLPGIIVTVLATLRGDLALAAANALGGVAAQTTFLGVADLAQRRRDELEETSNNQQLASMGSLLVLLAVPLFAITGWPTVTVGRVHPTSLVLVAVYGGGLWLAKRQSGDRHRADNVDQSDDGNDQGDDGSDRPNRRVWLSYVTYVAILALAGTVIGTTISPIAESLGLTSIAAGALLTAGATSTPELVTAVTAARRGNAKLAFGDIVGGNNFDVLFLAVADLAVAGSLYADLGNSVVLLVATAILLNAIVLLGFSRHRGDERFSAESLIMLVVYLTLAVALLIAPPAASG